MNVSVKNISQLLFDEVRHCKQKNGNISDELLSALHFIFGQSLLHSLDLVDKHNITKLVSPSSRTIYQVVGSSGQTYTCMLNGSFCTCPSYTYTVLVKMDSFMCKHLLAVNMAEALGNFKERQISNESIVAYLSYDC